MNSPVVLLYTVPASMSHWALYAWGFQSAMPRQVQNAIGMRYHKAYTLTDAQAARIEELDHVWTQRFEVACRDDMKAFPALVEEWGDPETEGVFTCLWSESITAPAGLDVDTTLVLAEAITTLSRAAK